MSEWLDIHPILAFCAYALGCFLLGMVLAFGIIAPLVRRFLL